MKSDPKTMMIRGLAETAGTIDQLHQGLHLAAIAAKLLGDKETAIAITETCEHFHAIDDKLKAICERLAGQTFEGRTTSAIDGVQPKDTLSAAELFHLYRLPEGEGY